MSPGSCVLVFVEQTDGVVSGSSLEALAMGKKAAAASGIPLAALVLGRDLGQAAQEILHYGVEKVYCAEHELLADYHPDLYVPAFLSACESARPGSVLMAETLLALDLVPRLAFALGVGCLTDCVSMDYDKAGQTFVFTKPVYSGNVMGAYTLPKEPMLATFRARATDPAERQDASKGEVVKVGLKLDASAKKYESVARVLAKDEGGPKLENATIVVSGGRGLGGPEGFETLGQLAALMGGALGASRPPCDLGWVNPKTQVGITGTIVAPPLYIAVGISGSTQHVAGMADSKKIVAINNNKDANIFKVADYGVIGDFEEVIPAFSDAVKKILNP